MTASLVCLAQSGRSWGQRKGWSRPRSTSGVSTLFKILTALDPKADLTTGLVADNDDYPAIAPYAAVEEWTSDLANGVLKLGPRAVALHGLSLPECGLLSLTRCYEAEDRGHILSIFEQAATTPSSFCFSATIVNSGFRYPVFCLGRSLERLTDPCPPSSLMQALAGEPHRVSLPLSSVSPLDMLRPPVEVIRGIFVFPHFTAPPAGDDQRVMD